ncbi:MAG: C-GCAxxG-C-C family protein [Oscillospiraceae bacterium]|jgi:C_GCAxxG_C_C family probable redox protein|nr:C-GCAxxG-C-C family protein [Oscillospiraceae bacterium]
MNKSEQAIKFFNDGYNCAQAVLAAYCEEFGLSAELALKIASGFGAGMGRQCETCGAVTGADMVLGLKCGYVSPGDTEGKEQMYPLIKEFARRFKARNHSTLCEELLGTHLLTGDRELAARQVKTVCPKMVKDAAEILKDMLMVAASGTAVAVK